MESIHQGYASWSNSLARFAGLRRNRQTAFTQSGIVATYSYAQNSSFVSGIVLQNSVSTVLTTAKTYDNLNRLQSISQSVGSKTVSSCAYTNNVANQRVRALLADGSYWLYEYNDKGEVISGKRYWSNGSPVVGQQFEYAYDDIGNRISTNTNGQPASYTANNLNQYTERQVPRNFAVVGSANPTATVTVDGSATSRHGSYFAGASSVSGTSSANKLVTITGVKPMGASGTADVVIITTGTTFVPGTPETFTHDLDGNLTGDGRWTYTWDAENRLIQMDTKDAAVAAGAPRQRLQFTYDWQGRRVQKVLLESSDGTNYTTVSTTRFLYDGWNLIAELDGANSLVRSYLWGLDLSGSPQGAGGVGGLLAETVSSGTSYYPYYDGNGNVLGLVDFSGSSVAAYEYGPFGEPVRVSGAMVGASSFRFSTKCTDSESGLRYYGYRYYDECTGRWISDDPIASAEDEQAPNLYLYCSNAASCYADLDGRKTYSPPPLIQIPAWATRKIDIGPLLSNVFGIYQVLVHWDITITDSSGKPIVGAPVNENITYPSWHLWIDLTVSKGSTQTTDANGKIGDSQIAHFCGSGAWLQIQQDLTISGKTGGWLDTLDPTGVKSAMLLIKF